MTSSRLSIFKAAAPVLLAVLGLGQAEAGIDANCSFNGIPLYGKVKVVRDFADIKIAYSDFPDLKVKWVDSFPDECGEWQQVSSFPDFTVQFVDAFPDISIKPVTAFPGM